MLILRRRILPIGAANMRRLPRRLLLPRRVGRAAALRCGLLRRLDRSLRLNMHVSMLGWLLRDARPGVTRMQRPLRGRLLLGKLSRLHVIDVRGPVHGGLLL